MRKALSLVASLTLTAGMIIAALGTPATAETVAIDFESYSTGSIHGQDGWSATGAYDYGVVDPSGFGGFTAFGSRSFRISNALTSGSFGDWAFSKSLGDEAGESTAANDGLSGGTRQTHFEASFDIASAVPGAEQPGLQISLSPDRGDGARMSFLRVRDTSGGLEVDFADYQSGLNETGCTLGSNFVTTTVASGLDRSVPHSLRLEMDFLDGEANDAVEVYVDGALVHTGTSWEDYFRECEGNPTRTVDSILLQARSGGGTAPGTLGQGFLIDNLRTTTSPVPASTTVVVDPVNMNGWGFFNEGATGDGALVFGPTGSLNDGSAQLVVDATGRHNIGSLAFAGTRLDEISELSYMSYRASPDPGDLLATSLQFEFDDDLTDAIDTFRGRLVFEPYLTVGSGNIAEDTWYTWDALDGKWWSSNAVFDDTCSQASPCTIQKVLATWPNAGIRRSGITPTSGLLNFRAGGPWAPGFDGNVDDFHITVSGAQTIYDFEPLATLGSCYVDVAASSPTIYTLLADCVTDETIVVPQHAGGTEFDGNGFSITGVDPAAGHFLGAVVRAEAGLNKTSIHDLTVTTSGLADVCDPATPADTRLRGILYEGVGGTIKDNVVVHIQQGPSGSGCQEGNAIEVRNEPFDDTGTDVEVTIDGNDVSDYIKNGITVNGSVAAIVTNNIATGLGPVGVPLAAQNGIQIGFGATAQVEDNTVSGHDYTPTSFEACGLLFFEADGVKARRNTMFNNERDVCNFGRGGGTFTPHVP
ncbi:MAG TPA: right-handed parallel beta-helix repeat-containing protein [Actinomycetota bacterium]|nr:right-handed parallel beta-helix repeat-containing protein [Actinomycetota bacterium]